MNAPRAPWWWTALLAVTAAGSAVLIEAAADVLRQSGLPDAGMSWMFPVYIVLSAVSAWLCWSRRRTMAWLLLALMLLTDAGLFLTTINPPTP